MLRETASSHLGLYRAGLTGPDHRRHITVGRAAVLEDALEILRKNIGRKPRHHQLFIGPRGIGKTHLLSLIEDEIADDPKLGDAYMVARFPEESHRTLSFADFLLGLCEILRDILPGESQWAELHQRLATEENNAIIADMLAPAIRQRYRDTGQTLIVMLENLNQIFDQQIKDQRSIAALRGFFMEDNGCLLIATAPLHFGAITDSKRPFYDFFDVQILDQLSDEGSIELIRRNLEWEKRDDILEDMENLRPRLLAIYRMTGGSPRLTLMLYELIANESVTEVKRQFELLLDRITPFYQDRMSDLPPQERAVLETIAVMRDCPKTPNAIAGRMRMKQPQVSSLLRRLTKSQYLRFEDNPKDKRSRLYVIREGFFDIWLAMNVSRGERVRLPFLLDFFAAFYPQIELRNRKRSALRELLAREKTEEQKAAAEKREPNRKDVEESLDYLSEVGEPEEKAAEKLRLAAFQAGKGDDARASEYLLEARMLQVDPVGRWIIERAGSHPLPDYLGDMEDMIACWDARREGGVEAFAAKLREIGEGLTFKTWSLARIAFLRDHLALLPEGGERVELRLRVTALLRDLAQWKEAESEGRLSLQEAEQTGDEPLIAWAMNELALLLQTTNRLAEAEPLMRRALAIDTQSYGAEHPDVAIDLNNLALLLHATNRLAEAELLMRRALAIDEQSFGAEHPTVAIRLNNLAMLLEATNRLAEAEPLMRRALAIDEQSFGAQHPNVARDLNNLAQLLKATNRLAEAE
ncbi:MAG: tetratricopeptide repeat protein, partial [Planctomycetota bacterium]|nr:tetratricopeptide repeat protein [Planctomycetota bacterium]